MYDEDMEEYENYQLYMIYEAMYTIESKTCIKFQQASSETTSCVTILNSPNGYYANLGKLPEWIQPQRLILADDCFHHGVTIHELMHTICIIHEQNRPDRDDYVKIHWENIRKGGECQFNRNSWSEVNVFNLEYDYNSIMHYKPYAFTKYPGQPTITPKNTSAVIGQRLELSASDIEKMNIMFIVAHSSRKRTINEEMNGEIPQLIFIKVK